MATLDKIKIHSTITFELYAPAILGVGYTNAKVQAVVDYATATSLGYSPQEMHVNVFPYLPAGSPKRAQDYFYALLVLQSGSKVLLGLPWIKEETIVEVSYSTLTLSIPNVGPQDQEKIVKQLAAAGYKAVDLVMSS